MIDILLSNGYTLSADVEENTIDIHTTDPDGVYNQPVARVMPTPDHESFQVDVYSGNGDTLGCYIVGLHRDYEPDDGEDEIADDIYACYGDTGENIERIQRRLKALGYFDGNIGGNYLTKTQMAVEAFQEAAGLHINGACIDRTTYDMLMADDAAFSEDTGNDGQQYAQEMDWWTSDIQKIFAKGVTARITDVETRLSWNEQRRGGTNHADVQPLTKEDTAKLKKAYGGKWAWTRRAIWVTIDGHTYAASMNGMPHGGSSISGNGFDGHHCIHFTNSRTHGSNKICPNHQKAIKKAATTPM